jgi:mannose-1-phosphate guanylyltransferase
MQIRTAIIIAGGKGTRMRNLDTEAQSMDKIHKSMIQVKGRPLLERILIWLKKNGVENVVIGVAHNKDSIINYFGDGSKLGLKITYSHHDENGGTGDAFKTAIETCNIQDKYFYALNSDQISDFNLSKLAEAHMKSEAIATILLTYPPSPFGMVKTDNDGNILSFDEKPRLNIKSNTGIYVFDKEIKDMLHGDVEKNTFVKLSQMKKLKSITYDGFFETINTYKDLIRVEETLKREGIE